MRCLGPPEQILASGDQPEKDDRAIETRDICRLLFLLDETILLLSSHAKLQEAAWLSLQRNEVRRGSASCSAAIDVLHKLTTNMGGLADLALYTKAGEYDFDDRKRLDQLAEELYRLTSKPSAPGSSGTSDACNDAEADPSRAS